jgi:hypothetical protein
MLRQDVDPYDGFGILDDFASRPLASHEDRAYALVAGALLEQTLEQLILIKCRREMWDEPQRSKLFGSDRDGAVNSFAGKITLAYALDMFETDIKQDLDLVRKIRNAFAHAKRNINFDTQEIADMCRFGLEALLYKEHYTVVTPKMRFIDTAAILSLTLVKYGHELIDHMYVPGQPDA